MASPREDDPFARLLAGVQVERSEARARISTTRVALFGLAGAGAALAELLHRCGVGALHLVDPFPCREGDRTAAVSSAREQVVAERLGGGEGTGTIRTSSASAVNPELVRELAKDVDVLVCTFDPELAVVSHWVNHVALVTGTPALFGALHGDRAVAGPRVVPGETACYQCWRLRRVACADDVHEALAREERRLGRRRPDEASTPPSPPLTSWLAESLARELMRILTGEDDGELAGCVVEHASGTKTTEPHRVLERPDCPACGGRVAPGTAPPEGGVLALATFVGPACGRVRRIAPCAKDPDEPELPLVLEAELANHRFAAPGQDPFPLCFGKGMTPEAAQTSTLGEAAEHYAGSWPTALEIVRAPRRTLDGPSLDPRRLVLYADAQYETLPHPPYREDRVVGWVKARSWRTREEVFVPALAALLTYPMPREEAYLFPMSTNGLAAGPGLPEAILSALLEVVERDAFLNLWLHRLPARRVDPLVHPDEEIVSLCRAYARRGVSLELYAMPTDVPVHAFIGLGVEPEADPGPAVVVGLGADPDPARAARSALLEVAQTRPSLRRRLRDPAIRAYATALLEDVHAVVDVTDHCLRYALPPAVESFAFLRGGDPTDLDWTDAGSASREDPAGCLDALCAHLGGQDRDVLFCDLTSSDVGRFGVRVARAIVPDFQPLHFGRDRRRLGGARLYSLPRLLGLRSTDATADELNDEPHPLA